MVKITRKELIGSRLSVCRKILRFDTQRIRFELVKKLRDIFNAAHVLAQNRELSLVERHRWARVAAYCAQTIDSLCEKFDERQIDRDLAELERLVNEATAKNQSEKLEEEIQKERGSSRSSNGQN